jgi:S1-C subfamily serine protease
LNASVQLLRKVVPATVHIQADIPEDHASSAILGAERMGTGVVLGSSGAIVTAHYVLIGARSVQVTALDGTTVTGQIAGIDYQSGLGIIEAGTLSARGLALRPLEDVMVGEDCFVVASVGEGRQVRTGFVASLDAFDAFWEYMLDRAILASPENPGLGGGPLVDSSGRVIGIAALSLAEVGRSTFAIPASLIAPILDDIRERGRYATASPRAWLGVTCYALRGHVVVAGVIPNSPAAHAGLKPGDLILAIDGVQVSERRELFERLWQRKSGDSVTLNLFRDDHAVEVVIPTTSIEVFFGADS